MYIKVVAIPDLHLPWVKLNCLKETYKIIKYEKPTHIVQLGDLYDQYVFSKYDRSLNLIRPKDEIIESREMAIEFWKTIRKIAPYAKYHQLLGNHDMRFSKRIMNKLPELESEIEGIMRNYFTFPGVHSKQSDRDILEIDGVVYCHGWLSNIGKHMIYFKKPCVHAHTHKPDLVYMPLSKSDYKPLWELDCGTFSDDGAVPSSYTNSIITNWKPSISVIEKAIPRLIML